MIPRIDVILKIDSRFQQGIALLFIIIKFH